MNRRAFTLIELILVMAILTVAISLTAPALANFFRGRSLDSEARRLLALTRQGQSRAISEGVPMELWIDAEQSRIGLEAEPSYSETDSNAVVFTVSTDIQMELVQGTRGAASAGYRSALSARSRTPSRTAFRAERSDLPRIRFNPDGGIDEDSPEGVRLTAREGGSLIVRRSRTGAHYALEKTNE